jgi:hypothetical protein
LPASETTLQTAGGNGSNAVASGLGLACGANALEAAQERQAILDALPLGHTYSVCNEVRAAGVAPLYNYEARFSERLDGDGDGIGCTFLTKARARALYLPVITGL